MARKRDYKAEYQRRIANAAKRGLSRSQARGHARHGEKPLRAKASVGLSDHQMIAAIRALRQTNNQGRAAKEAGVSAERFRRFLREHKIAERKGKSWLVSNRLKPRMTVISNGEAREITLRDFEQGSLNGKHGAAVGVFLRTNDIDVLQPFEGQSVIDAKGKAHPLETNASALYRLDAAGSEVFHEVYRLIL